MTRDEKLLSVPAGPLNILVGTVGLPPVAELGVRRERLFLSARTAMGTMLPFSRANHLFD